MVLYHEVQRVLQPWLTALLAGPVVIVLFGLFQQVVLGRPWGNHPVSNRAFLLIAGALCLFVVWFLNHSLSAGHCLPCYRGLRRMGNTLELLHLHDGLHGQREPRCEGSAGGW